MLKWNWRDAILYEADAGGSGAGNGAEQGEQSASQGEMSAAEIKAELERTRAALRQANKEAGDRRKKLDEIEAAEKQRKEQEMSEAERARADADKATSQLKAIQERYRTNAIRSAIQLAAVQAGFVDPQDAVALADLSSVDVDENDNVTGAAEAVKKLATAKPHLVKSATPTAPNINSTGGGGRMPVTPDVIIQQKRTGGDYVPF